MKKKFLKLFVSIMMLCGSILPNLQMINADTSTRAVGDTFTVDSLTYSVISDTEVAINSCDQAATGVLNIPASVINNGINYHVTRINDSAFRFCEELTSVTIPEGVISIGPSAFYYCSKLTSIAIPNSVASINDMAFYRCSNLISVALPNSLTLIANDTFYGCTMLSSIEIPDNVTIIGSSAFSNCRNLNNITLPNELNSIRDNAFESCTSLESLIIPEKVNTIGNSAFKLCSGLKSITIPEGISEIGYSAFEGCGLTSVEIPTTIDVINQNVFADCTNLVNIVIPGNINAIEASAFNGCNSLERVIIENGVIIIGDGAFENCVGLDNVTIPESVEDIRNTAFKNCNNLTQITIPDSVEEMGNNVFYDCRSLRRIKLSEKITNIKEGTFYNCASLEEITIPNSVTSISNGAFQGCTNLATVTLSDSLSEIQANVFANCIRLKRLLIPESVSTIDATAFDGCKDFVTLYIQTDYAKQYAIDNTIKYVDVRELLSQLQEMVNRLSALEASDYTEGSYQGLQDALADATTAIENLNYYDMETAKASLLAAEEALVRIADYSGVDAAIADANKLDPNDYFDFSRVSAAIDAVVRGKGDDEQSVVDGFAKAINDAIAELVNISALKDLDNRVNSLDPNDYTLDSWNDRMNNDDIIQSALDVLDDKTSTQQEVDDAVKAIDDILDKLVEAGDSSALADLVANVPTDEAKYTDDSWADFSGALAAANDAVANRGTQDEIDLAQARLELAKELLVDISGLKDAIDSTDGLNEDDYTTSSWDDLAAALGKANEIYGKPNATKEEVNEAMTLLEGAIAGLVPRGDTGALEEAIGKAPKAEDEAKYSPDSWADLTSALNAANDVVANKADKDQKAIDDAKADLLAAIDDLVDRSGLKAAIDAADGKEADKDKYISSTWASLESAAQVAKDTYNKANPTKEEVDEAMTLLEGAIAGLEYEPADYSAVNAAIDRANDLIQSDYVDFAPVTQAIEAVNMILDITEQATVDGYANAINDAIDKLVLKDADYSAVNEAIEAANALIPTDFLDFTPVQEAIDAVVEGKKITEQEEVNGYAKAINDAIANLVIKTDKSQLEKAIIRAGIYVPKNLLDNDEILLSSALTSAKAIKSDERATQDEIDKATTLLRAVLKSIDSNMKFTDVAKNAWYYDVVDEAYARGLMTGTDDKNTLFSPEMNISRGMVATVLYRMAGMPKVTYSDKFPDVKENIWYSNAIIWANNVGVVSGFTNGTFGPDKDITRQDLTIMLRNYASKVGKLDTSATEDLSRFSDFDKVDGYAKSAVEWAVANKIISGKEEGKKIAARDNATRAECAKMFTMLQDLIIE